VQQAWQLANPDLRMGAPSLAWYAAFYDAVDATGGDLKRVHTPS
jgi:lysophospholipase